MGNRAVAQCGCRVAYQQVVHCTLAFLCSMADGLYDVSPGTLPPE